MSKAKKPIDKAREERLIEITNQLVMQNNKFHEQLLDKLEDIVVGTHKYDANNGNLAVQNESQEMKELIAAAENIRGFRTDITAKDIVFKYEELGNKKVIAAFNINRGKEGSDYYSHDSGTTLAKPLLENLYAMRDTYKELKLQNQTLETEMISYTTQVTEILKKEVDNNKTRDQRLLELSKNTAEKFSTLSAQDILMNSKELVKNIVAKQGQEKDLFYTIKEGCKWMLNKITRGRSPESASQTIDRLFEKTIGKTTLSINEQQLNHFATKYLKEDQSKRQNIYERN